MKSTVVNTGKGILNLKESASKFVLKRHQPACELSEYIKHFWIVRWDLRGQSPYQQIILTHPNVNMAFENGHATIYGVSKATSSHLLKDRGVVLGVKFMPGGFYPFWGSSVNKLTGSIIAASEVFGDDITTVARELEQSLLAEKNDNEIVKLVEGLIHRNLPNHKDEEVRLVNRIVEDIKENREFKKVDDVVRRMGINIRTMQRLFSRYIGVSPKWVIQRYRLHEAAEQMESGEIQEWTRLSLDLGYYDQAHFIRDFTAIIGKSPEGYVRAIR